jgi:tetratricopeptide (TPR) repeat protein
VKSRSFVYLVILCLTLFLAEANAARLQTKQTDDPELEQIERTIREAWQEADQYVKAGGKESDAAYPGRKWAETLWQYRQEHPGKPASTRATAEALHFLAHADQIGELIGKADSLRLDDAAWKRIIGMLSEAAEKKEDYEYLIAKSKFLLEKSPDREVKMRAQFALAQGFWKKGEIEAARISFQKVVAEYPNTPLAREADGNIHELDSLNLGQPAPLFAYRGINGEPVSLADFRGKVTLLNFWASW